MKLTKQGIDNLLESLDMEKLTLPYIKHTDNSIVLSYYVEYDETFIIKYCIELRPNQDQVYVETTCTGGYVDFDLWTIEQLIKQLIPYKKKAE